jgi:hypothetical protein
MKKLIILFLFVGMSLFSYSGRYQNMITGETADFNDGRFYNETAKVTLYFELVGMLDELESNVLFYRGTIGTVTLNLFFIQSKEVVHLVISYKELNGDIVLWKRIGGN